MKHTGNEWLVGFGRLTTTAMGDDCVILHDSGGGDSSRPNLAIRASVGLEAATRWSGDVFIIRREPSPSRAQVDVRFDDLQRAIDFLKSPARP